MADACRWCAEPLVEVEGRCRACGEAARLARVAAPPRWDGDALVLPAGATPPACCLGCGDHDPGRPLHEAWTGGVAIRLCGPCREGQARTLSRRRAAWLLAVCAPLAVLVFAQEADRERLLGRVGVVGVLLALAVAGRAAGRVRVLRRTKDEVWLALPDPAAVRAGLRSP